MEQKLFVGLDISKLTVDVTFFALKNIKKQEYKQFENTKAGYKEMHKWIYKFVKFTKDEVIFCMENTGVYSLLFSMLFTQDSYFVWLENPLQIKQSLGIKRGKNDKLDSLEIATYAFRYKDKAVCFKMPSKVLMALQDLEAYRERLLKVRKSLSQAARELFLDKASTDFIQESTTDLVQSINLKIKELESKIETLIEDDEELSKQFKLAVSVKGIGTQIAVFMLIHTQGFTSFETVRQFACYCGVAPFAHTSGTSIKGKTRVSKLANKKLKSLLHMGALTAIKYDAELKAFYERKQKDGKHHLSIMNVIKNKLISRVFSVVKRGEQFMELANYQEYKKAS
jgi:transposase